MPSNPLSAKSPRLPAVSGRFDAPEFRDAFTHLERVILGANIPLGAAALTREQTRELLHRGHRLPVHGFDVLMLSSLMCSRQRITSPFAVNRHPQAASETCVCWRATVARWVSGA